jgi:heme exporter protein B
MDFIKSIWAIFVKDVRSELRLRFSINTLGMFTFVSVSAVLLALKSENNGPEILSGMFWVVIFFTGMPGLSRIFISEEEKGTAMTLQLVAQAEAVYFGKLLFNIIVMIILSFAVALLYVIVFPVFTVKSAWIFIVTVMLGGIGFAAPSTIIAAVISRSGSKGTLFTVLSFPILFPLLWTAMDSTAMAIRGDVFGSATGNFEIIAGYIFITVGISYLLFEYVWRD